MPFTRALLTSLCVCGFATASAAGPAAINVKPGLWQMSSSGEIKGAPPMPAIPPNVLANMPPAQRARIQAAMAHAMGNAGKPHLYKYCVTEKSLQRGFNPTEQRPGFECKPTVLSRTASSMDVREECTGPRQHVSGRFHFEAPNPVSMIGTINMTMSEGGHTMHVKRVMHGQWIAANCGKYASKE